MVTPSGWAAGAAGTVCLALGLGLDWTAPTLLGLGLLAALAAAVIAVTGRSGLRLDRSVQPDRVVKGQPAIVYVTAENIGRLPSAPLHAVQPFGDVRLAVDVPGLRPRQHLRRVHRLPTAQRGLVDAGPLEVVRRDAFGLLRRTRHHGQRQQVWVQPRILPLTRPSAGRTRHLEGPSSDSAPVGTVTFHRLREYVQGDDLRLVHWPSSARTGQLVVRHHVDTSQPFTVVLLDVTASGYAQPEDFEEAVDVAASVASATAVDGAPVQLRLSDGTLVGGPRAKDVRPHLDVLTGVTAQDPPAGATTLPLHAALLRLRRLRGGSTLVVVTGRPDPVTVQLVAGLRRRFDRVVLICLDDPRGPRPRVAGVDVLTGADADAVAAAWNGTTDRLPR